MVTHPSTLVVLDTNAVFDLWLFREPACRSLCQAIGSRALQWVATPAMTEEFFDVVERGRLAPWQPDATALRAAWASHCEVVSRPNDAALLHLPRCSDADDQKFIDLAIAHRARWLFTKDRAVLRLATRLRAFGVEVRSPDGWAVAALAAPPVQGILLP